MLLRRYRWLPGLLLLAPAAAWAVVTIVVPTVMAVRLSTRDMVNFQLSSGWSLHHFQEILSEDLFRQGLVNALRNGLFAAAGAVVLSVPLAHWVRFHVKRHKAFFLGSIVIALWMGYLLRIFGWRILLGRSGVINGFLQATGITDEPLSFLVFNQFAVSLTQTHLAMPFAFIPIYAAMERVPVSALQAAADLGAGRVRQFLLVELPLVARGVIVGGTFAFILAFGDFFAPTFVGSPSAATIGNLAADNFRSIINWPLGAALGIVMMVTVLLVLVLAELLPRAAGAARRLARGGAA